MNKKKVECLKTLLLIKNHNCCPSFMKLGENIHQKSTLYVARKSVGLDKNCGLFTNGQVLSHSTFFCSPSISKWTSWKDFWLGNLFSACIFIKFNTLYASRVTYTIIISFASCIEVVKIGNFASFVLIWHALVIKIVKLEIYKF